MAINIRADDSELSSFSARLCSTAESIGLRRRGLAARLAELCDVTDKAAHKWITGEAVPSLSKLKKLARALGTTPPYLLFGEEFSNASIEPLPAPLCLVNGLYRAGELDDADLKMLESLARMLVSKNSRRTPEHLASGD